MTVEQGQYGLWYSKGVGFATKEQAQAHEDGTDKPYLNAAPAPAKKAPAIWPGLIVAAVILISVVVIAVKSMSNSESPSKKAADEAAMQEIKLQRVARENVSKQLKDPGGADFRNQSGLCGEVNSKNSLGAFTGYQKFVVGGENLVVLQRDSGLKAEDFEQVWAKVCK